MTETSAGVDAAGLVSVSYKPPGPVTRAFLRSDAFVRGIRGPIGSGKSTACVMEIMRRACEQRPGSDGVRRSRWAVIRNTYPELKTTTIKTWHQWFPPSLGRWRDNGPPTHHIVAGDVDLEVMFIALDTLDDVRKLLSLEITGAWINEAREVPKAVLDGLTGRVGRFPSKALGGASWFGIIMDTNPPDTDHWWYRLAEEEPPEGWAFFAQPPGDSPDGENVENLPWGYYSNAAAGKDPNWITVYVRGQYGFVQDGKPVFPEYVDAIHGAPQPLAPVKGLKLVVGIDFGLTPAAVIGQRLPTGRWLWLDELVAEDMGAKRFGEMLGAKLRSPEYRDFEAELWGDPAGDIRAQTDETTPFQILNAAGSLNAQPAPSNDVVLRLEAVRKGLGALIDGRPGVLVSPRCRVLRKAMNGAYRYRRLAIAGSDRYTDKPEKNSYSHVADAAQYMMLGAGEGSNLVGMDDWKPLSFPKRPDLA